MPKDIKNFAHFCYKIEIDLLVVKELAVSTRVGELLAWLLQKKCEPTILGNGIVGKRKEANGIALVSWALWYSVGEPPREGDSSAGLGTSIED